MRGDRGRDALDAFMGVTWGEWSPKRKGKRLGTSTRDLVTSNGRLEDIKVPLDREEQFHTQAFERDTRYEPHMQEHWRILYLDGIVMASNAMASIICPHRRNG